jgi:hypothetical protein
MSRIRLLAALFALLAVTAIAVAPASGQTNDPSDAPSADLASLVAQAPAQLAADDRTPQEIVADAYASHDPLGQIAWANRASLAPEGDDGHAPSPTAGDELADELDDVPDPVRRGILDTLAAFADLQATAQPAFADADPPPTEAPFEEPGAPLDPDEVQAVLSARADLLAAVDRLETASAAHGPVDVSVDRCPDLAIDLTHSEDTYTEDCTLVIDAGGDDAYENNAGGTGIGDDCGRITYESHGYTAALVDLEGNDVYGEAQAPASCGANGGGWGGVGLLYDAGAGQDRYLASDDATNGGGLYGIGLLHDGGGDDLYTAGGYGTNGGGVAGIGSLVDEGGSDTYRGERVAVNGGAFTGVGLLLDDEGEDTYEAGAKGTNGGTIRGVASLVDLAGNDTYRAAHTGVNGGSRTAVLGFPTPVLPPSAGLAFLVDGGGQDTYRDNEGGAGPDETVTNKGSVGAQVDVPHLPDDHQTVETGDPAPDARPHVVVGVPDGGVNPYHEQFRRPDLTEHPCTYIPDYPSCAIPALNLTLDAPDIETALEEDADLWDSVEPGQWYWIPKTSFVAVACEPDETDQCILSTGQGANSEHGTQAASSIVAENPDALLAYKHGGPGLDMFLNRGLPVDLYGVSWAHDYTPRPLPGAACGALTEHERVGLYVKSTADFSTYPSLADCWDGGPNVVAVEGGTADPRTATLHSPTNPDLASYLCRPVADAQSMTQRESSGCGGNSGLGSSDAHLGGPTAAGAISKVLQAVREETGYTGHLEDGVVDPAYDDGEGLTVSELREAVNRTASYEPEAQYDVDASWVGLQPINPAVPWVHWGWGFYDGWVANATIDHLLDANPDHPAKPLAVQAYMETQHNVQDTYFGAPLAPGR